MQSTLVLRSTASILIASLLLNLMAVKDVQRLPITSFINSFSQEALADKGLGVLKNLVPGRQPLTLGRLVRSLTRGSKTHDDGSLLPVTTFITVGWLIIMGGIWMAIKSSDPSMETWPHLITRWDLGGLLEDLIELWGAPLFGIFTLQALISRALHMPLKPKRPIFQPWRRWLPAMPFLIVSSLVHEISHWIIQNFLFESKDLIIMKNLLAGTNLIREPISREWTIDFNITYDMCIILVHLAGFFGVQLFTLLVWQIGSLFKHRPTIRYTFMTGAAAIAARSFFQAIMSLSSDQDFGLIRPVLGNQAIWAIPLIFIFAIATPSLILWIMAREEARHIFSQLRSSHETPPLFESWLNPTLLIAQTSA